MTLAERMRELEQEFRLRGEQCANYAQPRMRYTVGKIALGEAAGFRKAADMISGVMIAAALKEQEESL